MNLTELLNLTHETSQTPCESLSPSPSFHAAKLLATKYVQELARTQDRCSAISIDVHRARRKRATKQSRKQEKFILDGPCLGRFFSFLNEFLPSPSTSGAMVWSSTQGFIGISDGGRHPLLCVDFLRVCKLFLRRCSSTQGVAFLMAKDGGEERHRGWTRRERRKSEEKKVCQILAEIWRPDVGGLLGVDWCAGWLLEASDTEGAAPTCKRPSIRERRLHAREGIFC